MVERDGSSPVLPDYGSGSIADIVPTVLGSGGAGPLQTIGAAVAAARSVVLLVLDGLGWNQLSERSHVAPTLAGLEGGPITSVVPSTTTAALTSITTGLAPSEHGIIGYRMHMGAHVMNVLRWGDHTGDLRTTYPPRNVQPCPPFLGRSIPVLSKAELEGSGFTEAHLDGVRHRGWRAASSIAVEVGRLVAAGERFVYAYYDGVDKIAHERGFGDFYDAELSAADELVGRIIGVLPESAVLLVTADHGQVHVGANNVSVAPDVAALTDTMSGEGRFRWLHARHGTAKTLLETAVSAHSDRAWVVSRERIIDERWFGPSPRADVRRRMGDVALVAKEPVSFDDPAESGGFELVCRHGSLTEDEMFVPLLFGRGVL